MMGATTLKLLITAGAVVSALLRIIGNALYQPDEGERVSTWSIRRQDARIFFLLLYGLWVVAAAVLAYAQYDPAPLRVIQWATPPPHVGDGSVYAVAQRFGSMVVPLMALALILTPIVTIAGSILMSFSKFIEEKILDPFIDAKVVAPNADRIRAAVAERVEAQVTAQVTEAVTAQVTEEVTAQVTEAVTEQVTEAVTAQVTEEVTAQVTEAVTAQVTEEVTAQVRVSANERWAAWLSRRDAALAQGREFNEPRPDEMDGFQS